MTRVALTRSDASSLHVLSVEGTSVRRELRRASLPGDVQSAHSLLSLSSPWVLRGSGGVGEWSAVVLAETSWLTSHPPWTGSRWETDSLHADHCQGSSGLLRWRALFIRLTERRVQG